MASIARTLTWIVALAASAVLGQPHEAHALALLADGRFVYSYVSCGPPCGLPPVETLETPAAPFAPFHVGGQDSELALVTQGLPPNEVQLLSGDASGELSAT